MEDGIQKLSRVPVFLLQILKIINFIKTKT